MGLHKIICLIIIIVLSSYISTSSSSEAQTTEKSDDQTQLIDRSSHFHHHHHQEPAFQGIWKKKFVWRPRWIKTWQQKKIYVAVWKHLWGPVMINEWVPIPRPPPGWLKHTVSPTFIKHIHH